MTLCLETTSTPPRYPRHLLREVVIVDDSPPDLRMAVDFEDDLMLRGLKIIYVQLDGQLSVGAKRNLAVERCTGEAIVQ